MQFDSPQAAVLAYLNLVEPDEGSGMSLTLVTACLQKHDNKVGPTLDELITKAHANVVEHNKKKRARKKRKRRNQTTPATQTTTPATRKTTPATRETTPATRVAVGSWIKLLWPDDDTWYRANVLEYNEATGEHTLLYDDKSEEIIDLTELQQGKDWIRDSHPQSTTAAAPHQTPATSTTTSVTPAIRSTQSISATTTPVTRTTSATRTTPAKRMTARKGLRWVPPSNLGKFHLWFLGKNIQGYHGALQDAQALFDIYRDKVRQASEMYDSVTK